MRSIGNQNIVKQKEIVEVIVDDVDNSTKNDFINKVVKDMRIAGYDNYSDWQYITRRIREKLEIKTEKKSKKLPTVLSDYEIDLILDTGYILQASKNNRKDKPKIGLIIETMFKTGLRNFELCKLRIENIDFQKGIFKIVQGKGSKDRYGVMAKSLIRKLVDYIGTRKSGYVFLTNRGDKYSTRSMQLMVEEVKEKAGIFKEFTPHTFRHTFATILLREGRDIREIQQLLGHSNIETTTIYTHIELERLAEPVKKIMDRIGE